MYPTLYLHREQLQKLFLDTADHPLAALHFHAPIELNMVISGTMEAWVGNEHRILHAGDCYLSLQYETHGCRAVGDAETCYLIIPAEICKEFLAELGSSHPVSAFITASPVFDQMLGCFWKMKSTTNELQRRGYLYVLLGLLQEQLVLEPSHEKTDQDLSARALRSIHRQYTKKLTLPMLAAELGVNPGYLSRHFKETFHIGLHEYILSLRLRHAAVLLQDPNNSITFCAPESGFHSLRTFYRVFSEEFHCTPKEYRQKMPVLSAVRQR